LGEQQLLDLRRLATTITDGVPTHACDGHLIAPNRRT
jgi:hypothetical protein